MSSITLFILFVCIIAVLFLVINLIFAPHNPYQEKYSIFECGFHSFLGQNRTQFGVKFFIFALVYLLLDLEILLTFPFAVSGYVNNIYGLMVTLGFIGIITVGFVYELGKSALKIDSRQIINKVRLNSPYKSEFIGKLSINYNEKSKQIYLESNIIPLSFFKSISKYFTFKNFLIGFSTIFIVSLLRWLGVPQYIISNILFFLPEEIWVFTEYFIYGTFALIIRLGFKGLIEEILKEPLPSSLPLHMAMDNNNPSNDELSVEGREGGRGAGSSGSSVRDTEEGNSNSNLAGNSTDNLDENKDNLDKSKNKGDISDDTAKQISDNADKRISDEILDELTDNLSKLETKAREEFNKQKEVQKEKKDLTEEEKLQASEYEEAIELRRMFDQFRQQKMFNAAKFKKTEGEAILGESSETTKRKASDNIENQDDKIKQTRLESNRDEKSK